MTNQEFIEQIAKYVVKYAKRYGICVHSPIIAQAILESGWGKSSLAATYHNYFGMKCGSAWKGKSVNMSTKEEYTPGTLTDIKANFRVYDSMEEGVKGYFEFIQASRYSNLKGVTNPRTYLENIKADGYATSSNYVDNVYAVITKNNLTRFDDVQQTSGGANMLLRSAMVNQATKWLGRNEADSSYKEIIDIYNTQKPLPRGYKVQYTDAWCATFWSACAIASGCTKIVPLECSCNKIIELAKTMGIWVENDAYIAQPGDAVLYDWQDSGVGDNTGSADHIGMVVEVNEPAGKFVIIEGNYSNAVKKRTLSINGRYIRGFVTPRYDGNGALTTPAQDIQKKSNETVAREVIAGTWGNGETRKKNLAAAGYDYNTIQKLVNQILNGNAVEPTKTTTNSTVVNSASKEVIATDKARKLDKLLAGTYYCTANLYMRNGAGTNNKALVLVPKNTKVVNYGYYSEAGGKKWLYNQVVLDGVKYTGFQSIDYLKK